MTVLDPAHPGSDGVVGPPASRAASEGRSPRFDAMRAWLSRLGGRPALQFGVGRNRDAAGLTDRQLADVGLTRGDLPDQRGWRR